MNETPEKEYSVLYRLHAIQRMAERNVSTEELGRIIKTGKVLERYKNDSPFPSRLILGQVNDRPLHVVIVENNIENKIIVTTVYEPDPRKWSKNDERR
ncbi:MAG: DUF4258 domain-containing protein [Ignavibacteriaceae bacterium]|nr:DUF4258 domain-containing protein [Ignavibacteriaceae bacterium]